MTSKTVISNLFLYRRKPKIVLGKRSHWRNFLCNVKIFRWTSLLPASVKRKSRLRAWMGGSPREQFEYNLITVLCYSLASLSTGLYMVSRPYVNNIDCEGHLTTCSRHRSLRDSAERCFVSKHQGHFTHTTTSNRKYPTFFTYHSSRLSFRFW